MPYLFYEHRLRGEWLDVTQIISSAARLKPLRYHNTFTASY